MILIRISSLDLLRFASISTAAPGSGWAYDASEPWFSDVLGSQLLQSFISNSPALHLCPRHRTSCSNIEDKNGQHWKHGVDFFRAGSSKMSVRTPRIMGTHTAPLPKLPPHQVRTRVGGFTESCDDNLHGHGQSDLSNSGRKRSENLRKILCCDTCRWVATRYRLGL